MVNASKELGVDWEAAVEIVPRFGDEPHSKFTLEHYDGTPEDWPVGKKLESEGRWDLIWNVRNTDVKVGQVTLEDISLNDLQNFQQEYGNI